MMCVVTCKSTNAEHLGKGEGETSILKSASVLSTFIAELVIVIRRFPKVVFASCFLL